jgi:hypothetical protein
VVRGVLAIRLFLHFEFLFRTKALKSLYLNIPYRGIVYLSKEW